MSRKCDQEKYRRRRAKEQLSHIHSKARRVKEEAAFHRWLEEQRRAERERWLRDPRRIEIQKIVNIIETRLQRDPLYRLLQITKMWDVSDRILSYIAVRLKEDSHVSEVPKLENKDSQAEVQCAD